MCHWSAAVERDSDLWDMPFLRAAVDLVCICKDNASI